MGGLRCFNVLAGSYYFTGLEVLVFFDRLGGLGSMDWAKGLTALECFNVMGGFGCFSGLRSEDNLSF